MPLVRIEIIKGKSVDYKKEMLDAVHTALMNAIQIEDWDRFQRLYEIEEEFFERSEGKTDKFTMIEITMFQGRTKEQKARIYEEIVKELQKKPTGKSLFILDEPTTGLHSEDIKKLLVILQRIVDNGDTVLVIEHNLDVIKVADYIIDLGPEGGNKLGGNIVCTGTPEEVSKVNESYTGQFLKKILEENR